MPIANCLVTSNCQHEKSNLIDLWADESGQSPEHMTINIISSSEQLGNKYSIVANLLLPSAWSQPEISLLQLGLAKALAKHYSLALTEIHVNTSIVQPGMVVEDGREMRW